MGRVGTRRPGLGPVVFDNSGDRVSNYVSTEMVSYKYPSAMFGLGCYIMGDACTFSRSGSGRAVLLSDRGKNRS